MGKKKTTQPAVERHLAQALSSLRANSGLTKSEVAREMETSYSLVDRWENGQATPSVANFVMFAAVCNASESDVLRAVQPGIDQAKRALGSQKKEEK